MPGKNNFKGCQGQGHKKEFLVFQCFAKKKIKCDKKRWSLLALENQIITHLWASFYTMIGHTDLSFISVTKFIIKNK